MEEIKTTYRERLQVSRRLRDLFFVDVQLGSARDTEMYECDGNGVCLTSEGVKTFSGAVPMLPRIFDKDIFNMLKVACKSGGGQFNKDATYSYVLYNPACNLSKLNKVFEEYAHPTGANRNVNIYGWVNAPFVSHKCCYVIPDDLGAIVINTDKFGAFCFSDEIFKVDLE